MIKLLFVLSFYQASVERKLNISESVNKMNIGKESVIVRKLIIDHMQKKKDVRSSNIELSS